MGKRNIEIKVRLNRKEAELLNKRVKKSRLSREAYADPEHSNAYSPEDLFCCEFAPYFMEGIKIRYPEYCRELPPARKQAAPAR